MVLFQVRRIEAAEKLAHDGRCPLQQAQAAVFRPALGDREALERMMKELRKKVGGS